MFDGAASVRGRPGVRVVYRELRNHWFELGRAADGSPTADPIDVSAAATDRIPVAAPGTHPVEDGRPGRHLRPAAGPARRAGRGRGTRGERRALAAGLRRRGSGRRAGQGGRLPVRALTSRPGCWRWACGTWPARWSSGAAATGPGRRDAGDRPGRRPRRAAAGVQLQAAHGRGGQGRRRRHHGAAAATAKAAGRLGGLAARWCSFARSASWVRPTRPGERPAGAGDRPHRPRLVLRPPGRVRRRAAAEPAGAGRRRVSPTRGSRRGCSTRPRRWVGRRAGADGGPVIEPGEIVRRLGAGVRPRLGRDEAVAGLLRGAVRERGETAAARVEGRGPYLAGAFGVVEDVARPASARTPSAWLTVALLDEKRLAGRAGGRNVRRCRRPGVDAMPRPVRAYAGNQLSTVAADGGAAADATGAAEWLCGGGRRRAGRRPRARSRRHRQPGEGGRSGGGRGGGAVRPSTRPTAGRSGRCWAVGAAATRRSWLGGGGGRPTGRRPEQWFRLRGCVSRRSGWAAIRRRGGTAARSTRRWVPKRRWGWRCWWVRGWWVPVDHRDERFPTVIAFLLLPLTFDAELCGVTAVASVQLDVGPGVGAGSASGGRRADGTG